MQDVQNLRCVCHRSWRFLYLANIDLGCLSGYLKIRNRVSRIDAPAEFLQVLFVNEYYAFCLHYWRICHYIIVILQANRYRWDYRANPACEVDYPKYVLQTDFSHDKI